jgi:hypothetical protein
MKPLFYILLLFFSSAWPQGQDASLAPRPVVNADIIEMGFASKVQKSCLEEVSTVRGSGWVRPWESKTLGIMHADRLPIRYRGRY